MIIEYKMADDEIAHLEVDDSLGQIIFELDKYEKNKNRAETRRHTILSLSDKDIKNVDVNEDILNIILKKSNLDKLHIAISKLKPQEQDLIHNLFFKAEPMTQAEYAKTLGITENAVQLRLLRIKKKLKKFIS